MSALVRVVALVLLFLASPAHAAATYPSVIPIAIGGFAYVGQKDYEQQQPGAGRSYSFNSDFGRMDVYVFSAGLRRVPNPDDVAAAIQHAKAEIDWASKRGHYSNVSPLEAFSLKAGKRRLECESFSLVRKDFGEMASFVCVGVAHGQLLKVRLSVTAASVKAHPPKAILTETLRKFGG